MLKVRMGFIHRTHNNWYGEAQMTSLDFSDPDPKQHSRIDLEAAIALYQNGDITAKGLVYQVIKIYRRAGQVFNVSLRWLRERLAMPRSTFYKALASLRKDGRVEQLRAVSVSGLKIIDSDSAPGAAIDSAPGAADSPGAADCQTYRELCSKTEAKVRYRFEQFVRREYRRQCGQEIRFMHKFLGKADDFTYWRDRFLQQEAPPMEPTQPTTAEEVADELSVIPVMEENLVDWKKLKFTPPPKK